ncbi:MFS transporter [Nonomuraea sp. WAC 01424]|uniref:MFS transporter n=1 Tax=Nonomuraea sp. WAC 01424 TaxID=2203200 RepID=UPI000F785A7A|nr:MFS transporter [Nonomuraea sp. WAC 01424]RSN11672.1 MFS transporter [Nonomuraea sp. WAC 01424]
MPRAVYVLAIGIFAMVTSEFAVGGLMPEMASGLGVTISQVGYLITAFAVAMAAGGPLMTVALVRIRPKPALTLLFAIFLAGNVLAAVAPSYSIMMVARLVTGVASQAFFGVAISVAVQLSRPEIRGRALAVVLNGLMLGTLLGLPLSTLIGGQFGWRAAFWAVGALTVIAALATMAGVPRLGRARGGDGDFRQELTVFRNGRLWLALATSTLIIGATFAAFSYLSPILTQVTGFTSKAVPLLLVAYGAATVVGNFVVGRLADRHTIGVLLSGLVLNTVFLAGFALFAHLSVPAVLAMLGVGLAGVTMNPAMAVRVQRAGNPGPLVNTVHASFITLGVIIGSSVGGLVIDRFGLRAPLWLGVGLAVLGTVSLLPELARTRARSSAQSPAQEHAEAATP